MEPDQAERDARVERILGELDDVEARMEELRPASQIRTMVFVVFLLLVILTAVAGVLFVPGAWSLAPFLIAATAYALFGLRSISAKGEELAELKSERARLTGGPTA